MKPHIDFPKKGLIDKMLKPLLKNCNMNNAISTPKIEPDPPYGSVPPRIETNIACSK